MGRIFSQHTMTFLIVLGIVTIVFVLATLFTSLTEEPLEVSSSSPVALGTPEFRATIESIAHSPAQPIDSEIEMFTNGTLFLEDLLEEIEKAQNSVTITNYIFKEGEMSEKTIEALTNKAKEGVEIRILLDAFGGVKAPEEELAALEEAGGKVAYFRPMSLRSFTRIHRRTHVRAIVVDGRIGYTGGLAFDDLWLGDGTTSEKHWRDAMFKYEGRLARATQDHFNSLWRQTDGEILTGEKFYPSIPTTVPGSPSYFIALLHTPAPDVSADLLDLIWLTITGAKDHIYLSTPYLTPPDELITALEEAVDRGVVVEVIVPGTHTDSKLIQSATRSYYKKLLDAGVKVYEYQPSRFHEKFLTVDGHWSLIGSANMDHRSATLNVENVFGLEDTELAQILEAEFEHNKTKSKERTRENFKPTVLKQAYYRLVSLFVRQF